MSEQVSAELDLAGFRERLRLCPIPGGWPETDLTALIAEVERLTEFQRWPDPGSIDTIAELTADKEMFRALVDDLYKQLAAAKALAALVPQMLDALKIAARVMEAFEIGVDMEIRAAIKKAEGHE